MNLGTLLKVFLYLDNLNLAFYYRNMRFAMWRHESELEGNSVMLRLALPKMNKLQILRLTQVALFLGLVWFPFGVVSGLGFTPFDKASWLRNSHPSSMVLDLMFNKHLLGMSKAQVIDLLGEGQCQSADPCLVRALNVQSSGSPPETLSFVLNGPLLYSGLQVLLVNGKTYSCSLYI